jgi:hypothetical protein
MNYCLINATRRGTGTEADLYYSNGITTAGKTGTTTSNKDRWYCGFTGYYTAAVWSGFTQPEPIRPTNSNNPSAVLFKKVMSPLHKGLKNIALYDTELMLPVTVCLDSGKLATDACRADIRCQLYTKFVRTSDAAVYEEDMPTQYCDKHVMVDYCSCGGVAGEYCHLFAEIDDTVSISQVSLVKLTQSQLDELALAVPNGLVEQYTGDDWIYLLNDDGTPGIFKGILGTLEQHEDAPYKVCPKHTADAWQEYLESLPPLIPDDPIDPVEPTDPEGEQTTTEPEIPEETIE